MVFNKKAINARMFIMYALINHHNIQVNVAIVLNIQFWHYVDYFCLSIYIRIYVLICHVRHISEQKVFYIKVTIINYCKHPTVIPT